MNRRLLVPALLGVLSLAACRKEVICPAGQIACGLTCVSPLDDELNCGGCGNACDARGECVSGVCGCAPGATACDGTCVDLTSDATHCGACAPEAACGGADVCSAGACAVECGAGLTGCGPAGRDCVALASDRFNCGACGNVCSPGLACREGACRSDLQVACFATNEVQAVTVDLAPAGPARPTGVGPIGLALDTRRLYVANSISSSLTSLPLDPGLPGAEEQFSGNDLQVMVAHQGLLFLTNSGAGTLLVYDPLRAKLLDEIPLASRSDVNPRGLAFVGDRAFVALYGRDHDAGGQAVAVVDLAGLATCVADDAAPCGKLAKTIDLRSVAAASDAPGLPFPVAVVAVREKVYVAMANLKKATEGPLAGFYVEPAGPARLAVVDTGASDALAIVPLGDCRNAGALAYDGARLWASCADAARPALAPVDVSGSAAVPGALRDVSLGSPGNLAFCGGMGYVTDLWSGTVLRFDPDGNEPPLSAAVCPTSAGPFGFAWAADVACAP